MKDKVRSHMSAKQEKKLVITCFIVAFIVLLSMIGKLFR